MFFNTVAGCRHTDQIINAPSRIRVSTGNLAAWSGSHGKASYMHYAAVVLYFRLGTQIYDTLDALMAQSSRPDRIVLVDNASGDGVLDSAEDRYDRCTLLQMPENMGYAAGMNAGAALLAGKFDAVLFMTHEVLLGPDCASRLLHAMESDEAVGMVGPALRLKESGALWSLGGIITRRGNVRHNTNPSLVHAVRWLDGACLLIRSKALHACGGFDEDYFLYWEDVDISLRIAERSAVCCVPDATAYQDTAMAPLYLRLRNQVLCWRKHSDPLAVLMAVATASWKAIFFDVRTGSREHLRARSLAVLHGFSGQMAPEPIRMLRD
ncbi:glycosyltransferase family 2 protein [Mycolicibacterium sp. GCM10028919]|uniref:glycosyltransferase family 2 protein n=1 Tax=Mycolicibacterium sp. GCM10028919 TaxID=3273401 RepID=UPI00362277FA